MGRGVWQGVETGSRPVDWSLVRTNEWMGWDVIGVAVSVTKLALPRHSTLPGTWGVHGEARDGAQNLAFSDRKGGLG